MEAEENCYALVPVNYTPPQVIEQKENDNKTNEKFNPIQYNIRIDSPYVGLANIGSTCYMNSVLQSLFMTPEFRKNIFQFQYNKEEHVAQEDCIPFQLQKLLAKMQLNFSKYIDTKDLIKSFGWNQHEAFDQHDCQEFIRILFDAISNTILGSQNENFISDLYEGSVINYVQCLTCNKESIKQELFLDLNLTVKNIFDKIYNDSIEKALQIYLKPELLDGNNQYFCENCQQKQNAKRGTRFCKLPKIISFILNRFTFDYFAMKRIKLDDYVSFPYILNMNDYMNGYEGIKNKQNEQVDPSYFVNDNVIKPSQLNQPSLGQKQKVSSKQSEQQTKKQPKVRSSNQTQDFLKNMKKGIKPVNNQIDIIIYTKELNQQNEIPDLVVENQNQQQQQIPQPPPLNDLQKKFNEQQQQQTKSENKNTEVISEINDPNQPNQPPNLQKLLQDSGLLNFQLNQEQKQTIESQNQNNNITESQRMEIEPQELQKKYEQITQKTKYSVKEQGEKVDLKEIKNNLQQKKEIKIMSDEERKQIIEGQKIKLLNNLQIHEKECVELREKYLKDGPLVYELQSILLHSGGAYGGHYYAFIKSFEDNNWHIFNDSVIYQMDVNDIPQKAYGGTSSNAYMLFYKQVDLLQNKNQTISNDLIHDYLKQIINKEKIVYEEQQMHKEEQQKQQQVRVFYSLSQKLFQTKSDESLNQLFEHVIEEFKIKEKRENIRLRAYKQHTDTMLDTYTGRENLTLEQLKIGNYKNLCVQIKKDEEVFDEFDSTSTYVRLCVWKPNIISLEEKYLELIRVNIQREAKFAQVIKIISQSASIPEEQIVVIQRQKTHGSYCFIVLNCESNMDKTLDDLDIIESTILYVERRISDENLLQWPVEFENEDHRVVIRFNSPMVQVDPSLETSILTQEFPLSVVIDNRKSIIDLKTLICQQLSLNPQDVVLRKQGRHGAEIKESAKATVDSLQFVNGSSVFLEFGKPAREGEFRIIFYLIQKTSLQNDICFHDLQEVGEIPVPGEYKASQVKELLAKYLEQTKGISLNPKHLRLREKVSNRVAKIYREKMIKDQQVIDKREIAIEVLDHEENLGNKEQQIYVRYWNTDTWELSDRLELIIKQTESGVDLGMKLASLNNDIQVENMQACRIQAIWNFNKYDLLDEDWHSLNSNEFMLGSQPFFIQNDGYLLIIKDGTKIPRELTEEEIKQLGVIVSNHTRSSTGGGANKKQTGYIKEKTLQIKIKKKDNKKEGENQPIIKENDQQEQQQIQPLPDQQLKEQIKDQSPNTQNNDQK